MQDVKCAKCEGPVYCSRFCKAHFLEYFERKVAQTISKYAMFGRGDHVLVAVSGGKDSTALLFLLHKMGYDVTGVMVEPEIEGYTDRNRAILEGVCAEQGIQLSVLTLRDEFGMGLEGILERTKPMKPCAVCGILKRYLIHRHSKGFDAVATGHTMDDEVQAFLMNVFRNDTKQAGRNGPVIRRKGFVPRVKPLYLLKESETAAYAKAIGLPVKYDRCPLSHHAYRRRFRAFLDEFELEHPNVKDNILRFYIHEYTGKGGAGGPKECVKCGEPSSGEVCRTCRIIGMLGKA